MIKYVKEFSVLLKGHRVLPDMLSDFSRQRVAASSLTCRQFRL